MKIGKSWFLVILLVLIFLESTSPQWRRRRRRRRRRRCNTSNCRWVYGPCTKSCGGGVNNPVITRFSGACGRCDLPPPRPCNMQCCVQDCVWSEWSLWDAQSCSMSCNGGAQYRSRNISIENSCGGTNCTGPEIERKPCNITQCCPVDCVWNEWQPYSACSVPCAGGTQSRNRSILIPPSCGGAACTENSVQRRECNTGCCPVNCTWKEWESYGECTRTCGGGTKTRRREIATEAECGGSCDGEDTENRTCNEVCCPVDCVWKDWEEWSNCSKPCGTGIQTAIRLHAVNASCGGNACNGSNVKQRDCNEFCCRVDCEVTEWMEWSNCSTTCGATGTSNRSRSISVMDACGGDPCPSVLWESRTCNRFCYNGGVLDDSKCVCSPQWTGECCQIDIDECSLKAHNCCDTAVCVNTEGSSHCECKTGYSGDGYLCLDLNECKLNTTTCPQLAKCVNTEGSFQCDCIIGFRSNGTACVDIDECTDDTNDCTESSCVNTYGSYQCRCRSNLLLKDGQCIVPECEGNEWTDFFSADTPDQDCDCEAITNLKQVYHQLICAVPTLVDARRIIDQVHWSNTGQNVTVDENGFICMNTESQTCDDYEVRLCCPSPPTYACKEDDWTPYYNKDDPLLGGDFETLAILHHLLPDAICNNPTGIEARLAGNGILYDPTRPNIKASPSFGFQCSNTNSMRCEDYTVRFCCPQAPPNTCEERHWTDYHDLDTPTSDARNDIENLTDLIARYPEVCRSPTAMDARLLNGDLYLLSGQTVHLSLDDGFQCFTHEQRLVLIGNNLTFEQCKDYMVRYCCPTEQTNDQCSSWGGEWTHFFDVDDPLRPGGNGDYELLRSIRLSHPWVCLQPYDIQASLVLNESLTGNASYDLSTIGGLRCENSRIDCRSGICKRIEQNCSNYRVRFCCPLVEIFDNNVDWCTVSNGLHYSSFDDSTFDFIGSCPFYLAKTNVKANKEPLHKFVVELETEQRSERNHAIKKLIVRIVTEVIEIRRSFIIVVNGIVRAIPFFENFFGYNIRVVSGMLRLDTDFGMFLRFDGDHIVSVGLNDKYGDNVEGLCGNYDGKPLNDFSKQGNRSLCSYESFIVEKYYVDDKCNATVPDIEPCVGSQLIQAEARCEAILKNLSCFHICTNYLNQPAFLQLCKDSLCNSPSPNGALKRFVEALIFECELRELEACSLTFVLAQHNISLCPDEETYGDWQQSSCEPTCLKPPNIARETDCTATCIPGCRCNEGLVRNKKGSCVKFEDCPCLNADSVPYLSEDCTSQCTCTGNIQSCIQYNCHRCVVSKDLTGRCNQEMATNATLRSSP